MTQETLFGFLTSTKLPVVSSLAGVIRWISLGLGVAAAVQGTVCWVLFEDGFWAAHLPWSGALPALASCPQFLAAWWRWRQGRLQPAATWLFTALFTLTILANWPRGAFGVSWYLHPVLALLATIGLGVIPGLLLTTASVMALLAAAAFGPSTELATLIGDEALWVHAASLASLTLASALAGAITNRLVFQALLSAEAQRRKNLESSRALRYREKLLRHALRVETIGDLAGMVCHQLRNSFQVLQGHVSLGELADDAERKHRLQLIERTLDETRPLLDQLMVMAHPEEGTATQCDLRPILRNFHEQARLVLPKSIDVACLLPEEPLPLLLNPRGLVHVLWNLTINARQAMQAGGRIVFRAGGDPEHVWFEVSDSGSGIPKELRERIFDPYFTTKPPGQGTGLGLTAVARFARSSNGSIQLQSELGKGTTFRLTFPRAAHAMAWSAARASDSA